MASALLEVEGLTVTFNVGREGFWGQRRRRLTAVDDISFSIKRGETFGLVGESGSGKTTTGRAILGKVRQTRDATPARGPVDGCGLRSCRHLNSHQETALHAGDDRPQGTPLHGPTGHV